MEGRYAAALYSAASKNKALDAVEKDMLKIQVFFLHLTNLHIINFISLQAHL